MSDIKSLKDKVCRQIEGYAGRAKEISLKLHANPEISYQEKQAAAWLSQELADQGFEVEKKVAGLETAFAGVYKSGAGGPTVCFMLEYDALPGLGHACGHNVHGSASLAAAVGLKKIMAEEGLQGTIIALGTPGEELHSGKVPIIRSGFFDNVDAAMMVHSYSQNVTYPPSLALDGLEFTFKGRPAHAAAAPHEGVNALKAAVLTFNGVDALREHVTSDVRIHGVIDKGGEAPNIVPEEAVARFYVRAARRSYLESVREKVKNCARGGALMTGAEVDIVSFEESSDDILYNQALCRAYEANWRELVGEPIESTLPEPIFSTDAGNVSQVVPTIHPLVSITDTPVVVHTHEFAAAASSDRAHQGLINGAKALAATALDVLTSPQLVAQAKKDLTQALAQ
ncbi:MAG: M20 family metallopeptidase [Deltaproteobacteria bacterium]|nr:M20 family metallopeptidase [Deltaproteobacteria bacterium]